jgi:hypothetical protein
MVFVSFAANHSPVGRKERMTPTKRESQGPGLALSHIERQFGRGSLMRLGAAWRLDRSCGDSYRFSGP